MNRFKNIAWGVILVVIGIIVGLRSFDIIKFNIFFEGWWTLFIIIPCFLGLLADNDKSGDLIGLLVGIGLLLAVRGIITFALIAKLLLPVILIIIGLSCIFKNALMEKVKAKTKKIKEDQKYSVTFSTMPLDYTDEKFDGCDLDVVFGGADIDLRKAKITNDVSINVSTIFGGVDINLPSDVKVKVTQSAIFGGVSNETKNDKVDDKSHTVYINAHCVFGGVDLK